MQVLYGAVAVFWLWMVVDFFMNRAFEGDIWTVVVFLGPIGALIYFFGYFLRNQQHSAGKLKHHQLRVLRALPKDQLTAENVRELADSFYADGRWADALEHYQRFLGRFSDHHAARLDMGECLLELKRPQEAIPELRIVVQKDPYYRERAGVLLLNAFQACDDGKVPVEDLEALAQATKASEIKYAYAVGLQQAGRLSDAKAVLQRLVDQAPLGSKDDRTWAVKAKKLLKQW